MQYAGDIARYVLDNLPAFLLLWAGASVILAALWRVFLSPGPEKPYPPELYPDCCICESAWRVSPAVLTEHQISVHGRVRW